MKKKQSGFIQHHFGQDKRRAYSLYLSLDRVQSGAGFTLIELLVTVAIIGLLASIVTVALGSARVRARDARRVSDIKQVKSGLDLYYTHGNGYPSRATYDTAYTTATPLGCSGVTILRVPQDPLYPTYEYTYTPGGATVSGCGLSDLRLNYTLTFILEKTGLTYTINEEGQITPELPSL